MQKNTTKLRNELSDSRDSRYGDIDITNDVMFATVMQQPDICIGLLENMFPGMKIGKIRFVDPDSEGDETSEIYENGESDNASEPESVHPDIQKTIATAFGKRGIRMDVYLEDGKTVYDVEMQTSSSQYLPKRSRHYGSGADVYQIEQGHTYKDMKPVYIIFICKFDPFGEGLYQYTFENTCNENQKLRLNDESYKIFFNTAGTKGAISDEMRQLLEYMNNTKSYPVSESKNELIHKIDTAVAYAKMSDVWRRRFMKYEADMMEAGLRGEEHGIALGKEQGIALGKEQGIALGEGRANEAMESLLRQGIITDEQAAAYYKEINNIKIS